MRIDDEVNISELFIQIYIFLRRKILFLILLLILGAGIGFGIYQLSEPRYEIQVLGNSSILSNNRLVKILNSIQLNLGNAKELAGNLNIDEKTARGIRSIKAKAVTEDKKMLEYFIEGGFETNVLEITIQSIDKNMSSLPEGLNHFLNQNSYISKKIRIRKSSLESFLVKIDEEIGELDSLQRILLSRYEGKDSNLQFIDANPAHMDLIKLYEKKQLLEAQLFMLEPLNIIYSSPVILEKAHSLKKSVITYSFIFLVAGIVLLLFIQFNRKVTEYMQKS
ncbi:MAG: hypothetical protein IIA45_00145 [Bacteroidetes bacterium]|nr:hypothetical protein [Bacteroidota bacterium]